MSVIYTVTDLFVKNVNAGRALKKLVVELKK